MNILTELSNDTDWRLFELAQLSSAQLPHTGHVENGIKYKPLFPFCEYPDSETADFDGLEHKSRYCESMQTTFNDYGVCYTFNNVKQFLDDNLKGNRTGPIRVKILQNQASRFILMLTQLLTKIVSSKVRKVTGCGKDKGLQLVLDANKISRLLPLAESNQFSSGYNVFVTRPGIVNNPIVFNVDPKFDGMHNFHLHGIHVVRVRYDMSI